VWAADETWTTLLLLGTAFTLVYTAAAWLLIPEAVADARRLRTHLT
jgi:hypothetical protein